MSNDRIARSSSSSDELKHSKAVHQLFSGIAGKYDLLNHLLSANIDKRWRRLVARMLADVLQNPKAKVLDVACGTGDLSLELNKDAKAKIIGTDFCRPMLAIAQEKTGKKGASVPYVEADGMNLSFADETFDAVTIAWGLRNFPNWKNGLIELRRVLKTGGRLIVLEFSDPVVPGFKQLFQFYFSHILPRIGGAVSGSRDSYEYLPDSVAKFPDQKNLAALMREIGFDRVEYKNLTGGIVAIHSGTKN